MKKVFSLTLTQRTLGMPYNAGMEHNTTLTYRQGNWGMEISTPEYFLQDDGEERSQCLGYGYTSTVNQLSNFR